MKTDAQLLQRHLSSSISELQRTIQMADTKANIVLVLIGVILSLFFNFFVSKNILPSWQIMTTIGLFFISGAFAISTLYPRVTKKSGKSSTVYYKDMIDMDPQRTARNFTQKNMEETIMEDYLASLQALSIIVDKKFMKLRLSYIFFSLGVILKVVFETAAWL
jgi:hypothetical protein